MTTYQIERAAIPIRSIGRREYRQYVFNFTGSIETDETIVDITGTDGQGETLGVAEATGLVTIGTAAINSVAITVDKRAVAAAKAVTVFLRSASGVVGTIYTVTCLAVTSTGQSVEGIGYVRVE